jgi:hypothetical protein
MGIVLIELLTGMDSMDARGLAEKEGDEYIAAAAYDLAKKLSLELNARVADPIDGNMQAVKILSEVTSLCIAEVKRRKTPKQLLVRVEAAHELLMRRSSL